MKFASPLIKARLLRRYKRFLADVMLESGEELTVHCPNPGAMAGLKDDGNAIWISDSGNPARRLRYTWELVEVDGEIIGVNTNRANTIARDAIAMNLLSNVGTDPVIKAEQKYGTNSRIDFLLEDGGPAPVFVEVKNVNFQRHRGLHEFPDGVTQRGTKHLNNLIRETKLGSRAMMLFIIQRNDGDSFAIAEDIDQVYGKTFHQAIAAGVNVQAICCTVTPEEILPLRSVEILF